MERNFLIIGEALRKIRDFDTNIVVTDIRRIIGLRNIIVHSYDSVDAFQLWSIIKKSNASIKIGGRAIIKVS